MTSNNTIRRAIRYALLTSAVAAASSGLPAYAQDQAAEAAPDQIDQMLGEELVVTGSRIPRANLTAPTQVTTIDSSNIQFSGLGNAADILRAVPSFGVSALSTNNSNFLTTDNGVNTLELRNLDEDRTLVLVNGRRYVPGASGGTSAVDFNTIPVELIDRVEIITGGASAIYGSDALAGVVNVILKDKFEGVDFGYQFGESTESDDTTHRIHFVAGGNFADDRGNAVVSASFTQQQGVLARDRPETAVDDISTCFFSGDPADCKTPIEGFFSSFSEFGRFFIPSTGESFTVDNGTGPGGTVVPWDVATYGFNRQHFRRYSTPTDRFLLSANASYDMADNVEAFIETMYANTDAESELEPFPHSSYGDLQGVGISINNPFMPQALRDELVASGDTQVDYFRRMTEVGQRGNEVKRNTYRLVLGLRGDINDRWDWDGYYGYGQMDAAQTGGGQINVANMREALNAIDGDGNPATFDPVCANPVAVAEGCVPINIFGFRSISPEAAAYVQAPEQRQQKNRQQIAGVSIGGPAFDLPAGPLSFAVGGEWRKEHAEDVTDALTRSGQNASNKQEPIFGDYDVIEGFVELEVPLLRDIPAVHELSIGAAYRYSDYSTVGTTDAYTGRLSWAPIESLRFRAQYARAVRAPNIGELFAPAGENFEPVADPCDGVTATSTGAADDRCRADPAIAQRIAATGSFTLTQPEIQGTGGFTGGGNPNLDAEQSDSYSVGAVFNNDFGTAGNFLVSVDWFQIEIDDTIGTVERQTAVDQCYAAPTFPNEFCALLTRDQAGPAFEVGELTEVNSTFLNHGTLNTEGVDLSVLWSWGLGNWFDAASGNMSLRLNYAHLLDFTEVAFGVTDDSKGEVGFAEDKAQLGITYVGGRFSFEWETTYIGDSEVDVDPTSAFHYSVGTYIVHDFQIGFDLFEGANLFVGMNNAFDEEAAVILSGVPGNTTGTDTNADVYNPIGRTWYAGMRVKF
jgi:outer membrane receptor protein involved in Fe transport